MGTIFRDMLRKKIGIRSDVVFVPMSRSESEEEEWYFLNYKNMVPSFRPIVKDSLKSSYMVLETFTYTFRHYVRDHNGKAYFFYWGKGHNAHINEKYAGSIWEFDISNPKNQWLNDQNQSSYYFYLTDADGNEFAISFDNHSLHTQEIQCCDLFFLENYNGGTRNTLYTRDFFLCDKFLEPLKEGDVTITDKEVYILKNISMIGCLIQNFQIKEKGCISSSGKTYFPIFFRHQKIHSNNEYEMIDGVYHLIIPCVKAPEHVVSKVIEWRFTQ